MNSLHSGYLSYADCFQNIFFQKFFQEHYQSAKQFGLISGSGLKLCAKVIRRQQNLPLSKERVNALDFAFGLSVSLFIKPKTSVEPLKFNMWSVFSMKK